MEPLSDIRNVVGKFTSRTLQKPKTNIDFTVKVKTIILLKKKTAPMDVCWCIATALLLCRNVLLHLDHTLGILLVRVICFCNEFLHCVLLISTAHQHSARTTRGGQLRACLLLRTSTSISHPEGDNVKG
jgi:hypothetical protein